MPTTTHTLTSTSPGPFYHTPTTTHTGTGLTTQDRSTTHQPPHTLAPALPPRTVLPHANHHTHWHWPYHPGPLYHTPTPHTLTPASPGPLYHTTTTTHTGTDLTRTVLPHANHHTHWHQPYHPGPFYHTPTTTHTGTSLTTQDRSTIHQPPHTLAQALPPRTVLPHANHHTHWHGPHHPGPFYHTPKENKKRMLVIAAPPNAEVKMYQNTISGSPDHHRNTKVDQSHNSPQVTTFY